MDQRILPGVEPLDTRQAVSQRLEGLEGDPPDLQWGLEPKAAVDGPPSVLVAGPRLTVRSPLTAASATFALKAGFGSGVPVPAVRQKLYLASCADCRDRLCRKKMF